MRTIINLHHNIKFDGIVREPKVVHVRDFDEPAFKRFNDDFDEAHRTGQTIIPVVIDSFGGECYALNGMISIIRSSKVPVATILLSKAMSCGALLFSCGHEGYRYMSDLATIMIHDVSSYNKGKVEEIKADAVETARLNDVLYSLMEKNIGKKKNYLKDIVHSKGHADWYIDAKEALSHNLTNYIGIPTFTMTARLDFDLSL